MRILVTFGEVTSTNDNLKVSLKVLLAAISSNGVATFRIYFLDSMSRGNLCTLDTFTWIEKREENLQHFILQCRIIMCSNIMIIRNVPETLEAFRLSYFLHNLMSLFITILPSILIRSPYNKKHNSQCQCSAHTIQYHFSHTIYYRKKNQVEHSICCSRKRAM